MTRFMPCTTAKIHPAYRRGSGAGSSKMIDFVIYLDPPSLGDEAMAAVEMTRKVLPAASINHTDFAPLRRRPIALSIEGKMTGHQFLDAEVQVGVWQAAQWRMLESLQQQTTDLSPLVRQTAEGKADNSTASALPSFLPAIIVQGNDWHFVATTRSAEYTVCTRGQPTHRPIPRGPSS